MASKMYREASNQPTVTESWFEQGAEECPELLLSALDFGLAHRQSSYLDFSPPNVLDSSQIVEQLARYDHGLAIPTREQPWHTYFDAITEQELLTIFALFSPPAIDSKILIYEEISALAVGSTTYSAEYWNKLEEFCIAHQDIEARSYAQRRGEDIDIVLCTTGPSPRLGTTIGAEDFPALYQQLISGGWNQDSITSEPLWVLILARAAHHLNWPLEITKNKHENGASYFSVPHEYRQQEGGRGIVRVKSFSYSGTTITLSPPNSRSIHIRARVGEPLREILRNERCEALPFSLLLEGGKYWDLNLRIKAYDRLFRSKQRRQNSSSVTQPYISNQPNTL